MISWSILQQVARIIMRATWDTKAPRAVRPPVVLFFSLPNVQVQDAQRRPKHCFMLKDAVVLTGPKVEMWGVRGRLVGMHVQSPPIIWVPWIGSRRMERSELVFCKEVAPASAIFRGQRKKAPAAPISIGFRAVVLLACKLQLLLIGSVSTNCDVAVWRWRVTCGSMAARGTRD